MKGPAWEGDWPLEAGEYYSDGTYHGSWDIGCPNFTDILAPVDGRVLDCVDGVPNVPGGPGSASNWILLGFKINDIHFCYYFQHLSHALVHKGQSVSEGHKIGESGESGNASGPHLHLTLQHGWKTAWTRYDYLTMRNAIYPPKVGWERWSDEMGLSADDKEWIKGQIDRSVSQTAHQVWEEEFENTTSPDKKKYAARWFINSILNKVK